MRRRHHLAVDSAQGATKKRAPGVCRAAPPRYDTCALNAHYYQKFTEVLLHALNRVMTTVWPATVTPYSPQLSASSIVNNLLQSIAEGFPEQRGRKYQHVSKQTGHWQSRKKSLVRVEGRQLFIYYCAPRAWVALSPQVDTSFCLRDLGKQRACTKIK